MIQLLNTIGPYLDVIAPPVALFFTVFRKQFKLEEHAFIVIYIFLQLFFNSWAKWLMYQRTANAFVYQANYITSLAVISAYFLAKYRMTVSRQFFQILLVISSMSLLVALIIAFTEKVTTFSSRTASFACVIICFFTISYFFQKLLHPVVEKITQTRSFWLVTGLFTYYCGSFFIVVSYNSFVERGVRYATTLWSLHNVMVLLMCISFSIGFSCKKYQTT